MKQVSVCGENACHSHCGTCLTAEIHNGALDRVLSLLTEMEGEKGLSVTEAMDKLNHPEKEWVESFNQAFCYDIKNSNKYPEKGGMGAHFEVNSYAAVEIRMFIQSLLEKEREEIEHERDLEWTQVIREFKEKKRKSTPEARVFIKTLSG